MGKKLKIFFIDDDIALGHICTRIMQEEGYEVLYQTSLNGAKACIVETHPDMIVLDVEIGNKNGIEAVPELKAIAPNTPILFISSHTNSQLVVQALSAGAVAYLKKPLEIDENYLKTTDQSVTPQLIKLNNVVFTEADGETLYAPEEMGDGDINRNLKVGNTNVIFRVSTYSNFANDVIPEGNVQVTGLLTRYNDSWQIKVRTGRDITKTND